jgi:hypothetical protein
MELGFKRLLFKQLLGLLLGIVFIVTIALGQNYKIEGSVPLVLRRADYRGPQIAGTSMTNMQLKSNESLSPTRATYISWEAPVSGRVREVWAWFKTGNKREYSGGNRGRYTVSLRPDILGLPASKVLAKRSGIGRFKDNDTADNLRRIEFKKSPKVVAGRTYHFVIVNTDRNPKGNWASLNTVYAASNMVKVVRPTFSGEKMFSYHSGEGKFEPNWPTWVVGIDTTQDGASDVLVGNPYVSVFSKYEKKNPWSRPISGLKTSRINYLVSPGDDHSVSSVGIAAYKTSGNGDMKVTLKGQGGSILATAFIPGSNYPLTRSPGRFQAMTWGEGVFDKPALLKSTEKYYLELSAAEGTTYYPVALQDSADSYGGPNNINGRFGGWFGLNAFAEFSLNGGQSWSEYTLTNTKTPSYVVPSQKWDLAFFVRSTR